MQNDGTDVCCTELQKTRENGPCCLSRVQSHGESTRFWASYHSKLGCLIQVLPHAAGTV